MEIESKYLIAKELPFDLDSFEKEEIEQAYILRHPTLRARKLNDRFILTVKADVKGSSDSVKCNEEYEVDMDEASYEKLKSKREGNLIVKTRYLVPLEKYRCGGEEIKPVAEVDVFHGILEGLRFAEVEFPSTEAAAAFNPPDWMTKNVSGEHRYNNGFLVGVNDISDIAFLL